MAPNTGDATASQSMDHPFGLIFQTTWLSSVTPSLPTFRQRLKSFLFGIILDHWYLHLLPLVDPEVILLLGPFIFFVWLIGVATFAIVPCCRNCTRSGDYLVGNWHVNCQHSSLQLFLPSLCRLSIVSVIWSTVRCTVRSTLPVTCISCCVSCRVSCDTVWWNLIVTDNQGCGLGLDVSVSAIWNIECFWVWVNKEFMLELDFML